MIICTQEVDVSTLRLTIEQSAITLQGLFGPQPALYFLTDFSLNCISWKVSRSCLRICRCVGCVAIFGSRIWEIVSKKVWNGAKCDLKLNCGPQPFLHFLTDFSLDCLSGKVSRSCLRICKCVGCVTIFGCEICNFVF